MIHQTPADIEKRYGRLFSRKYLVTVDEEAGRAEIIEQCSARGPIEWDAANRLRAGGATLSCRVEGSSMVLLARIGEFPVRFGPAAEDVGGQALEAVAIAGDEVITSWAGIAGAGVSVAACLPQAPGVLRAEFPAEEDLAAGGARVNRVRIISPKYLKVTVGIDNTDTRTDGVTWVLAIRCGEQCSISGVEFRGMRLIQLYPKVPEKTTNCVASAHPFAARPDTIGVLLAYIREYVENFSFSDSYGIAYRTGLAPEGESPFERRVKTEIVSLDDAEDAARLSGIRFVECPGKTGRIGAVGAGLWAYRGPEAAGLYGEHL
jgi:methanogenesis imperfect marker protein 11